MNRVKPQTIRWARNNRKQPTKAEAALWAALRRRQLHGMHFRRQAPLLGFIVDFYCARRQLVIELDGEYHDQPEQRAKDTQREAALRSQAKVLVIRFRNELVFTHLSSVLKAIGVAAKLPKPRRTRPRRTA